jgi:hypothetical protein
MTLELTYTSEEETNGTFAFDVLSCIHTHELDTSTLGSY